MKLAIQQRPINMTTRGIPLPVCALLCFGWLIPLGSQAEVRASENIAVTGSVLGAGREALSVVKLVIEQSGKEVLRREIELSTGGSFSTHVEVDNSSQLVCIISAPGFESQRITGLIGTGAVVALGTIQLKPIVELGPISVATSADDFAIFDFWITSYVARPLTFVSVSVSAIQPPSGHCFDSDPVVTLHFKLDARKIRQPGNPRLVPTVLQMLANEAPAGKTQPDLLVNGELLGDPCGPLTLRLVAPYSFTLSKEDQSRPRKIRIEIPASMTVGKMGVILPDWAHGTITVETDTQEKISGTAK